MTASRFVPLAAAALVLAASAAGAATDPSFLLTGTAKNFDGYFPGYLANGYFSTMTSLRGTEPNMAYMVAFMDYAQDDIARPAAVRAGARSTTTPAAAGSIRRASRRTSSPATRRRWTCTMRR